MTQKHLEKFLLYFLLFLIVESIVLISLINTELFLYKFLINYLFVAAVIPFMFEKIKAGRIDLFSPLAVFTFFYLLLFGFKAIDQVAFNREAILADEIYHIKTLLYAIIGLHFFQIGYFSEIGKLIARKIKSFPDGWSNRRIKIVTFFYSSFSIISFLVMIFLSGGFSSYFLNIHQNMISVVSGSAIIFLAVLAIKIPFLIWLYQILKKRRFSLKFFIYFLLVCFLLISLGERGHFVTLIFSIIVSYHYLKKRINFLKLAGLGLFMALFLVIFGMYRDFTTQDYKIKKAGLDLKLGVTSTYHIFMSNFDQLIRVKDVIKFVPEELDYQIGGTFLNLFLKPIPSRLWKEKPQGAGIVISKEIYPKHYQAKVSVAPSLLGELYLNFHIIGIIVGMFFTGIVGRALYSFLLKNINNSNGFIVYLFLLSSIYSELRGDFAVVTSFLVFNLVLLAIALSFITITKKNC
ncbi:MAG: O-antigen polysaccharide polymerase Wzy [Candidatus Lokiarchaeota archaeon]|nr:O-antigen polysaccharide polymerase Wzy [Candidatus Lokiarchaeota archaeon]